MTRRAFRQIFGALVSLGLTVGAVLSHAETPPPFIMSWGGFGATPGLFRYPVDISVGPDSLVYVIDRTDRVQVFTAHGVWVRDWSVYDPALEPYICGQKLTVSHRGDVWVLLGCAGVVRRYSPTGQELARWGAIGNQDGQFQFPRGIAVDRDGSVVISDNYRGRVQRFTPNGTLISAFGTPGSAPGQFQGCTGVAITPSGQIAVADRVLSAVLVFESDGTYVRTIGPVPGYTEDVTCDERGNFYLVDASNWAYKFSSAGVLLSQFGGPEGPGAMVLPEGIAVDPNGFVFVADTYHHRISKFGDVPTPVRASSWGRIKVLYR